MKPELTSRLTKNQTILRNIGSFLQSEPDDRKDPRNIQSDCEPLGRFNYSFWGTLR